MVASLTYADVTAVSVITWNRRYTSAARSQSTGTLVHIYSTSVQLTLPSSK